METTPVFLMDAPEIEFIHAISSSFAASDSLHKVLGQVVNFVSTLGGCDPCFIYILEGSDLVLRGSKNPHPEVEVVDRLKLRIGQGITGWVAKHKQPVAVPSNAARDPRFQVFNELPEDHFEAFLSVPVLCRSKLVGVINVQHRQPHNHTKRQIQIISTIGFLVRPKLKWLDWRARTPNSPSAWKHARLWSVPREFSSASSR